MVHRSLQIYSKSGLKKSVYQVKADDTSENVNIERNIKGILNTQTISRLVVLY